MGGSVSSGKVIEWTGLRRSVCSQRTRDKGRWVRMAARKVGEFDIRKLRVLLISWRLRRSGEGEEEGNQYISSMLVGHIFKHNKVISKEFTKNVSQVLEQKPNSAIANFTQWRHRSQREAVTCLDVKFHPGCLKVSLRIPPSSSSMVVKRCDNLLRKGFEVQQMRTSCFNRYNVHCVD